MTQANYVGSYYDWDTDAVMIWERDENGVRSVKPYYAPYYFYVPDEDGEYTAIDRRKLKKLVFDNKDEFNQATKQYDRRDRYESDIAPMFRVLMDEYYDLPTPVVHYAFLDIEVDYNSKLGFSSPENPYAPINAITIYQSWSKRYITYAVPPKKWKGGETFSADIAKLWEEHKLGFKPEVVLCEDEAQLLTYMIRDIQDSDIISGWNSEFFDLPYIMKRLEIVLPKLMHKMNFIGCRPARMSTVERFGSPQIVYALNGRTHLDYLDLFKKFTFEGRTSYSLANIAGDELDIPKLHYDGTLEQLYNRDFAHFVAYNARDVEVLVKLDDKFKFIALVNQMAHENTVPFAAMLGTVRYVETGITNRAHYVHGLRVPDKMILNDGIPVEGALVLSPKVGLHDWLGSVDINSLYPSVIRALNISPEMFRGQFEREGDAWRGIMEMSEETFNFVSRDGEPLSMTGEEWWMWLIERKYVITAFGTVFDQSQGLGIVPEAIAFWYSERKRLQAEKKKYQVLLKECTDDVEKSRLKKLVEHYDLLQLTKKIQLNSTYGALLSPHFRLGRKEMGASVTACGRQITTNMMQWIGELVTGQPTKIIRTMLVDPYNPKAGYRSTIDGKEITQEQRYEEVVVKGGARALAIIKPKKTAGSAHDDEGQHNDHNGVLYESNNPVILLSDTDSCYFKTQAPTKQEAIEVADAVAEEVNDMFPAAMRKWFNCQPGHDDLIKAGREIVGSRGLFLNAKKKYTIKVMNLDGFDIEGGKLKTVGSEMKKADTPKVIQDFLKTMMDIILDGGTYADVEKYVNEQRGVLITKIENPVALGTAKSINNLDSLYAEWQRTEKIGKGKVTLPGHVRAAINYNEMVQKFNTGEKLMRAGDKGLVFYLKPNDFKLKSIAFPADIDRFPDWFTENFRLDKPLTEQKMIDNKLEGTFEALNWEIPTPQKTFVKKMLEF